MTRNLVLLLVVAVMPAIVEAKRAVGDLPPPYMVRFVRSMLALLIMGAPTILVSAAFARRQRNTRCLLRTLAVTVGVIAAGAAVAAIDGRNDEGWNPAFFGGPFVAVALPVGVHFAQSSATARRKAVTLGTSIVAVFAALPLMIVGGYVVDVLRRAGWPVTW